MRSATLYYLYSSTLNQGRRWLKRLRRPQYGLVVAVALAWMIGTRVGIFAEADDVLVEPSPALMGGIMLGGAWALGIMLSLRWIMGVRGIDRGLPRAAAPLWISTPLSTGDLMVMRTLRAQGPLLLSCGVIWGYAALGGLPLGGLPLALTAWLVGTSVTLHEGVVLLAVARPVAQWIRRLMRAVGGLMPPVILVAAVGPLPPMSLEPAAWMDWLSVAEPSGPLAWITAPVFAIAQMPLSQTMEELLHHGVGAGALPLALVVLTLFMKGVHPGEITLGETGGRRRAATSLAPWALKIRLPLKRRGPRWRALVWLISTPVFRRDLPTLLGLFGALWLGAMVGLMGTSPAFAVVRRLMTMSLVMSLLVLPFTGPGLLRADLRVLLARVELVRALPLSGAELVRAAVYAPAALMLFIEVMLMAMVTSLMTMGVVGGRTVMRLSEHLFDLLYVLPAVFVVILVAFTAQNALVLMFPRWFVTPGARSSVGVPAGADGRTLLAGLAYGVVFALLATPPVLVAGGAALLSVALGAEAQTPWVIWGFTLAGLVVVEATLRLLGRHLDKDFDPDLP
ncbi:MAG: hypothetical protein ACE366_18895 [Bradymonadia bacterium]